MDFPKYPKTYHLAGSKGIEDTDSVPFSAILNTKLVIEEKVDGSCVGIAFDQGKPIIKHRNQDVRGEQWDLLKAWVSEHEEELYDKLEERYIMYGEWLYARHTISYDCLPSYFLEYDIFDTLSGKFLSTPNRKLLLANTSVTSVKVLATECFRIPQDIVKLFGQSNYRLNGPMEGLYLKLEDSEKVVSRYKYIDKGFLDQILSSGTHWMSRTLVKNLLGDDHVR